MNYHLKNQRKEGKQTLLTKMFLPFFILGMFLLSGCKISYHVPVTGVDIQEENLALNINEQETLTVHVSPENATNKNVSWTSEEENVATIDENGQVTGISEGETTITVTTEDGHFTDDCLITVTDGVVPVTGLTLDNNSINIEVDDYFTLTPLFAPSNATNQNVSWSSDNPLIATIADGVVLGKNQGTCTITATTEDGHFTATCLVNVSTANIHVTSVSLNQNTMRAYVGDTATLIANILPSNATNKNTSWASSNSAVATITNGVVSALSVGSSTITVTTDDRSYTDTCLLTVEAAEILSEKTIDSNANFSYGSYATNFGIDTYDSVEYGFYRVNDDYSHNGMILLYPSTDNFDYQALSGAFFNDT
ncbi:MAG: Ig-like domain-containing protein, partial [Bacilli bacterium]